jgi:hypothetical protein
MLIRGVCRRHPIVRPGICALTPARSERRANRPSDDRNGRHCERGPEASPHHRNARGATALSVAGSAFAFHAKQQSDQRCSDLSQLAAAPCCRRGRLLLRRYRRLDAVVTLGQLPVGSSVGAAAAVLILGSQGVAAAAAAGVLLTATGTVGGLCFAAWAGADKLWSLIVPQRPPPLEACSCSDTAAPLIADRDQGSPRTRRGASGSASKAQPRSTSQSGTLPRLAPALGRRPFNGFRRAAVAPVARRNRVQGCGHGQTKLRDGRRTCAPPCTASLSQVVKSGHLPLASRTLRGTAACARTDEPQPASALDEQRTRGPARGSPWLRARRSRTSDVHRVR